MKIKRMCIKGFKAFSDEKQLDFSNINLLFGANSSGKSSTIQALMLIKQTLNAQNGMFDVLINGRYVNLGDSTDVINKTLENGFDINITIGEDEDINELGDITYSWSFSQNDNKINHLELKSLNIKVENEKNEEYAMKNIGEEFEGEYNGIDFHAIVRKLIPKKIIFKKNKEEINNVLNSIEQIYSLVSNETFLFIKEATLNKNLDIFKRKIIKPSETKNEKQSEGKIKLSTNDKDTVSKYIDDINEEFKECSLDRSSFPVQIIFHFFGEEILEHIKENKKNYIAIFKIIEQYFLNKEKILSEDKEYEKYDLELNLSFLYSEESIFSTLSEANRLLIKLFNSIQYLGPIRERPKYTYDYLADDNSLYVGEKGQYFPGVLAYNANKLIDFFDPYENRIRTKVNFKEALAQWMKYLNIGFEIDTIVNSGVSINIKHNEVKSSIQNLGIGVSQVLPVLIMGLMSEREDLLIFEQPELHLHPFVQSKLIDFFISLANNGRQLIIETHSDYFVQKIRYWIIKEALKVENVKILFFKNNGLAVEINEADLRKTGEINYPDDFFDVTDILIQDIIEAKMERISYDN